VDRKTIGERGVLWRVRKKGRKGGGVTKKIKKSTSRRGLKGEKGNAQMEEVFGKACGTIKKGVQ